MGPPLFLIVSLFALGGPFATARAVPFWRITNDRRAYALLMLTAITGVLTFALRLCHWLPTSV
jgi:hypothetical protein